MCYWSHNVSMCSLFHPKLLDHATTLTFLWGNRKYVIKNELQPKHMNTIIMTITQLLPTATLQTMRILYLAYPY